MTTLLDSQKTAYEKLRHLRVGALFMEAGTGKTRAAKDLVESADPDYVLWLTPFQTKENLRAELDKWGGLDCEIQGIESLSNSDRLYLQLTRKIREAQRPFVICDESLKIKNDDAIRTQRSINLGQLAQYRLVLNGTPLSRNLLDLWSQMEFLSPKILNMNLAQFKNTFCEYVQITYHTPGFGRSYSKEFIKDYHNVDYLYSLIKPYIFESSLSLSVGLKNINLDYELTEEEKEEHDRLKEHYLDDKVLMMKRNNIFLELTQKMQHNYSCSPEKFKLLDKITKHNNPERFLVYAKFIRTQEELRKRFPNLQIMSLGKHSHGLNLQDYNRIVFFDKTWDYAQREQVIRRIHREGQNKDCLIYDMTSNAGLDALINQNIEKKSKLLDIFNEKTIEELKEVL